jgi:hypothetical protein
MRSAPIGAAKAANQRTNVFQVGKYSYSTYIVHPDNF